MRAPTARISGIDQLRGLAILLVMARHVVRREPHVRLRACAILGTVSYGAHLWNYPLTLWLRPDLGAAAGPVGALLTLVVAAASWRLVEEPAIRLGRRLAPGLTAREMAR